MAGSDPGDDEDDSAMATGPTEKVDSDEDSDRGSDHSGLKRKSLAMKVSVGWGQERGLARGHCGSIMELSLKPAQQKVVKKPNSLWILQWEMGLSVVWGSHSCLMMPMGWPILAGFAAWRRIQNCRSECSSCRACWEELEKALPRQHLLSRVHGEGMGFSHVVSSPLPDACDKAASEILQ